jgi:probable F420-dependent oxidoreductase
MEFGVFLPISGRAAGPVALTDSALQAEHLGFDAVWSADRVVTPWKIETPYPYSESSDFIVPPDRPFLDSLTCLAFLAGRTTRVRLGISVLVLPYRHPLYWARIATSIDRLSGGRFILGVGCGWMAEEFTSLNVEFKSRGKITDEQLEIARQLWQAERIEHSGLHYKFDQIAFYPKPESGLPTWIGGEGPAARRRAGRYGDAWFPYFVAITAGDLQVQFREVLKEAEEVGRNPDRVALAVCRPIEVTERPVAQDPSRLRGTPEQLADTISELADVGASHLALQFMASPLPKRVEQIERFGREVMPRFK